MQRISASSSSRRLHDRRRAVRAAISAVLCTRICLNGSRARLRQKVPEFQVVGPQVLEEIQIRRSFAVVVQGDPEAALAQALQGGAKARGLTIVCCSVIRG